VLRTALTIPTPASWTRGAGHRCVADGDARDDMLDLLKNAKDETIACWRSPGSCGSPGSMSTVCPGPPWPTSRCCRLGVEAGRAETGTGRPGNLPVPGCAGTGQGILHNEALKAEAQAAIDRITPKLPKDGKR